MNKLKTIRWQQRFENLNKAFSLLQKGLAIKHPSDIEQQGIISALPQKACHSVQYPLEGCKKQVNDVRETE